MSINSETRVLSERHGPVEVIKLNRPEKRNAIDSVTLAAFRQAVLTLPEEAKVVVIAGAGDHFCAGLDLTEHRERSPLQVLQISREWNAILEQLQYSGRPVVAALQGAVIGGGFEIAAAAHVRVAEEATFFALPEAQRGFYIGGGGSVRIARAIGVSRMTDMLLTGRRLDADAAERAGLVREITAKGDAFGRALALADTIATNAPFVNYLVTNALPRIADMASADGLFAESVAAALSHVSSDAQTGIDNFFGSRTSKAE